MIICNYCSSILRLKLPFFTTQSIWKLVVKKGLLLLPKSVSDVKIVRWQKYTLRVYIKNQIFNLLYLLIFHIFSHKKSQTFWKVWKSLCIKNQIPMICSNGSAGSSSSSKISISVSLELDFSSLFSSVSSTELVVLVFSITI